MGRPWNVQGFFQGEFMPQLINDYASYFLHSLIRGDDGYGADIFSLPMLLPVPPSLFSHSEFAVSIWAPAWVTDIPRIPFSLSGGRCLSARTALYVVYKKGLT